MYSSDNLSLVVKLTQKSDEAQRIIIEMTAYISQITPIANEAMSMPIQQSNLKE